jgi:hypothetical protein
MPNFEIQITTPLQLEGAKALADQLERDIGKAKALGTATDELEGKLKNVNTALENASPAAKEASDKMVEGAQKATLSHRELRETVGAVGRQFGGLADVGLWVNPMTAGIAAVLAAVSALKTAFEQLDAPVKQFNEAMLAIDTSRLKSAADSAQSLSEALSAIGRNNEKIQSEFNRGTTAMENRIKLYNEQTDGIQKVAEAEEKAYEAELDHQTALNPALKEQNDVKKEQARLDLDSLRGQNDAAKRQNEINELAKAFNDAKLRVESGADTAAVKVAQKAAAAPHRTADAATTAAEEAEKEPIIYAQGTREEETWKNMVEARKEAQSLREEAADLELEGGHEQGVKYHLDQAAAMDATIASRQKYIDNLKAQASHLGEIAKTADQKTADAKAQTEADQKLSVEGGAHIKTLQAELDIQTKTNAPVEAANRRAAASRAGTEAAKTPAGQVAADARAQASAADATTQSAARGERGQQAQNDASQTSANARILENHLRNQRPQDRDQNAQAEIHNALERMLGLMENQAVTVAQKSDMRPLIERIEALEREMRNHDQRMTSGGGYVH